ncbi:putative Ig domain-containing protein [Candidatus Spongiihabitans sp.]|uniref:putative Ig domain-containing protein n=1 Tax=Candidatus Spongiihabitans sp. TaxID=3101308 RepID=UPI003C6EB665
MCETGGVPAGTSFCSAPAFTALGFSATLTNPTYTAGTNITLDLPAATGGTGTAPLHLYTLMNEPAGLTFDAPSRTLSGIPTTAGETQLTYWVTDSASRQQFAQTFTITVEPGPLALPVVTDRGHPKDVKIADDVLPEATGGTGTLTYTLTGPEGGALPDGLSFAPDTRTLSGVPTTVRATELTYTATDSANPSATATRMFTVAITVLGLPPVRTPSDYEDYTAGVEIPDLILPAAFRSQVARTLTYTLTGPSGSALPDGLSFAPDTRTLSGVPTEEGETELTYTVTDTGVTNTGSLQRQQIQRFTITVASASQALALSTVPDQRYTVGEDFGYSLPAATGGTAPRSYKVTDLMGDENGLPGINFDKGNFRLRGTPTSLGTYEAIYTVTDANGATTSQTFTITVTKSDEDLNMDRNNVILSEMARAMADSTVSAIARRIGQAGSATRSVAIGGQSSLAGALSTRGGTATDDLGDFKKMLAGSGFTLPLNVGDGATGGSSLALWGSGEYRNLSGKSHNTEWDGDLTGAHLGFDARIANDVLAGLAVSWLNSDLDYKDSALGKGDHEIDLTSVHPYIGWRAGQLDLWATVGYGNGELERTPKGGNKQLSDINQRTFGVGGSGQLWQGGASSLRLKGEALQTAMEVKGGVGIVKQDVDATRLRMTVEASQSRVLAGGGVFEPSVEAGVRYDGGDGKTGAGAEVGGRLSYRNPATGVTAEGSVRALLGHSGDYEEWGVQGRLALQPGGDGQGLSFHLSPGYGDIGGGIQRLWEDLPADSDDGAADYSARMDARIGYGLSLRERDGVLTPYSEMTLGATDSYRIGLNWKAGSRFDLNLVGERREPSAAATEHAILLKGEVRF